MRFPRIDHIRTSEFPAALADREWWRAGCGRHGESGREVGRGRDQRHRRQRCPNPCHHRIRDQDRVLLPRRHRRRARRQPLVHRVAGQQDRPHQSVMADAASSSTGNGKRTRLGALHGRTVDRPDVGRKASRTLKDPLDLTMLVPEAARPRHQSRSTEARLPFVLGSEYRLRQGDRSPPRCHSHRHCLVSGALFRWN